MDKNRKTYSCLGILCVFALSVLLLSKAELLRGDVPSDQANGRMTAEQKKEQLAELK